VHAGVEVQNTEHLSCRHVRDGETHALTTPMCRNPRVSDQGFHYLGVEGWDGGLAVQAVFGTAISLLTVIFAS